MGLAFGCLLRCGLDYDGDLDRVDIGAENDVAQERALDAEHLCGHVNPGDLARFRLSDPPVLVLQHIVLQIVHHGDELVLVEGMSDAPALALPCVVSLAE